MLLYDCFPQRKIKAKHRGCEVVIYTRVSERRLEIRRVFFAKCSRLFLHVRVYDWVQRERKALIQSQTHTLSLTHTHSLSHTHTLTHTHSHTHTLSHTHAHSLSHTHAHTHSHTHTHSCTHTHTLSHTHSHTHTLTHTLTHTHTHSHTLTHTSCKMLCSVVYMIKLVLKLSTTSRLNQLNVLLWFLQQKIVFPQYFCLVLQYKYLK